MAAGRLRSWLPCSAWELLTGRSASRSDAERRAIHSHAERGNEIGIGTLLLLLLVSACVRPSPESDREILVFAAASLRDVMAELTAPLTEETGLVPVFNFAGSNVLALQIAASPAADVFLSADERWMDHLEQAGRLADGSRRVFLSNRLVVVAHLDSELALTDPAELAALEFRFLSLADPEAVPAGVYARGFLESAGLWTVLRDRVVPAPDVRAALALVEARPDAIGIVYLTDAMASGEVRRLYEVPEALSPPIRYSAAAVRGAYEGRAALFLDFLGSAAATAIFEKHGFVVDGSVLDSDVDHLD